MHGVYFIYRRAEMVIVDTTATGTNIKAMVKEQKIKIADIQKAMGFGTPQAIYKWFRGDTVPTIDNMVILADMLNTTIDKIIVTAVA